MRASSRANEERKLTLLLTEKRGNTSSASKWQMLKAYIRRKENATANGYRPANGCAGRSISAGVLNNGEH